MSKHEVTYDGDGLATCDPWTLDDYLSTDGFTARQCEVITESVLSWLTEHETVGCDLADAIRELERL